MAQPTLERVAAALELLAKATASRAQAAHDLNELLRPRLGKLLDLLEQLLELADKARP